jgi:hypothetical protein
MDLQSISFDKLLAIYDKYFSLGYLNTDISDKLACISLTCYITNELRKKGKKSTCYDVLLQIGKDLPDLEKNTFLKSLGAICESLMYGSKTFPDFGIPLKEMPKQVRKLLGSYCPF